MSEDRSNTRGSALSKRFGNDGSDDNEANEENETNDGNDGNDGNGTVRERQARTLYGGAEVIEEIDMTYEELSLRYRREHGEKLPKNKVYYPALLRAGVKHVEDELDLE